MEVFYSPDEETAALAERMDVEERSRAAKKRKEQMEYAVFAFYRQRKYMRDIALCEDRRRQFFLESRLEIFRNLCRWWENRMTKEELAKVMERVDAEDRRGRTKKMMDEAEELIRIEREGKRLAKELEECADREQRLCLEKRLKETRILYASKRKQIQKLVP